MATIVCSCAKYVGSDSYTTRGGVLAAGNRPALRVAFSVPFIMREQPKVVIKRLEQAVLRNHCIVVSAITYAYAEMRFGTIGKKASPHHAKLVDAFLARLDAVLAWDWAAVDATTETKAALAAAGTPLGSNDTAIAGHAIAAGAVLVTNNTR